MRKLALFATLFAASLCTVASAKSATVWKGSKVFSIQNRKVVQTGTMDEDTTIEVRKVVGKGKWLQFAQNGKAAYVPAASTDWSSSNAADGDSKSARRPSSTTRGEYSKSQIPLKAGLDALYGSGLGIGFGARFGAEIPVFKDPVHLFEAQGVLAYFPSGDTSSSSFLVGAFAKYGYRVTETIHIGPEAGFAFLSTSASIDLGAFGQTTVSASTLTLGIGGYAEGVIDKDWGWNAGMRMLLSGGSSLIFYGGAQYYF